LKQTPHALYYARVVKRDLVAMKFFDVVFDPNDNLAASRTSYYASPLRRALLFHFNELLDSTSLKTFWEALNARSEDEAASRLAEACGLPLKRIDSVSQERPRELISGALHWARKHPEQLTFYARSRHVRAQHYPNVVAFPSLLLALQTQADRWSQAVSEIRHDEQGQFGTALRSVHRMMAEASDASISLGTETIRFHAVPDSRFVMASSSASPGMQVLDVLLWLTKQRMAGASFGRWTRRLVSLMDHAQYYELSLAAQERRGLTDLVSLSSQPLTSRLLKDGAELLRLDELRRQSALEDV
jgi:hypothetical protein